MTSSHFPKKNFYKRQTINNNATQYLTYGNTGSISTYEEQQILFKIIELGPFSQPVDPTLRFSICDVIACPGVGKSSTRQKTFTSAKDLGNSTPRSSVLRCLSLKPF